MASVAVFFWLNMGLLVYVYVGYPTLIWFWAMLSPGRVCRPSESNPYVPKVSILVITRNESSRIQEKIENLLALDYPHDRLQIVIASDASTDRTVAYARAYQGQGVETIVFSSHRGKPAILNQLVPNLDGELVVLMDTRQRLELEVLRELVRPFQDPCVGAVGGELILQSGNDGNGIDGGVGFYWYYEKFIRRNESRVDSSVGVSGALYAIRKKLYRAIPENTVLDDVLIPMNIVRHKYRVLFVPAARAYDKISISAQAEYRRKIRTIAGNFQLFFRQPWLLNPFSNRLWLQTVSHKCGRLLAPLLLLGVLGSNLFLLDQTIYSICLATQLLFYATAFAGHCGFQPTTASSLVSIPYTFCLLNWTTVVGFFRFIFRRQRVTWQQEQ